MKNKLEKGNRKGETMKTELVSERSDDPLLSRKLNRAMSENGRQAEGIRITSTPDAPGHIIATSLLEAKALEVSIEGAKRIGRVILWPKNLAA